MANQLVNAGRLAQVLDLRSARRVQQLVHEGMPRAARGQYDPAACALWYIRYMHRTRGGAADARETAPRGDLHAAQCRRTEAEAALKELELAARRRDLVAVTDVLRSDARLFGVLRARVTAIRGKWAARVLGLSTMPEATATLDALADDVLAALADGADEVENDETQEAA